MAFQEITSAKSGVGFYFKDYVYVTKHLIKFSREFWEKELGKAERVRLFYDEDTNQVGLLPVLIPGDNTGFKVTANPNKVPSISWGKLVNSAKLHFEKTTSFQIINAGDKKEKMRIFCLNGSTKGE